MAASQKENRPARERQPEKNRKTRVAIIGTGLIGGSLGMALRQTQQYEVVGHDLDYERASKAKRLGAVDQAIWNLPIAVERADIVVVATPPGAIYGVFKDLANLLSPGTIVTDTASVKVQVMQWAEELLPASVSFVGGHPMAGKETAGIEAAQADLLAGCTYCLVPYARAASEAIDRVTAMVKAIGARPFYVEAAEHDSYVAAVSHLPFLLSASLTSVVTSSPVWRDMRQLAASGFRDTTRLASGDPTMHRDICLANSQSIARWLDAYIAELMAVKQLVEAGDAEGLQMFFRGAKNAREAWLNLGQPAKDAGLPSATDRLGRMFLGGLGDLGRRRG